MDVAAAAGNRSLRRGLRLLLLQGKQQQQQQLDAANKTIAFIFEKGPVVMWIAAADKRAKDKRQSRELLSSLLFFLSHFASRFVRADMVQEDVMRFAYISQVRRMYPTYEVPKSRILQDCIYLKEKRLFLF
ncbi:hypothetical protein, conserved [Eimeria maxima]|uniref:Uncharacterized protein n=1 Tax=Eimeria maxima TaxID=5804 RepID=U6LYE0_EIMMA|nr:hypothetical protein, conserved [Eimeria maxima]CDJ56756.1 hypothetical protein, conserved [Eimeria maxima]